MNYDIGIADIALDILQIENVSLNDSQIRMIFQPPILQAVAAEVVINLDIVILNQPRYESSSDESGASGDENIFPRYHYSPPIKLLFQHKSVGFLGKAMAVTSHIVEPADLADYLMRIMVLLHLGFAGVSGLRYFSLILKQKFNFIFQIVLMDIYNRIIREIAGGEIRDAA